MNGGSPHRRGKTPSVSRRKFMAFWVALAGSALLSTHASYIPSVPDNIAPHPAPAQPLPFSHKTHLASGLSCRNCHVNPEPGVKMTFPATAICMTCHATIARDKPAIKELQAFAESGRSIPWQRVYLLTRGVRWSHRAHLDAGTACETCHGEVAELEVMTASKAILAMGSCIDCHKSLKASSACVNCHAWPTDQALGLVKSGKR